jgi:hypothetical protein
MVRFGNRVRQNKVGGMLNKLVSGPLDSSQDNWAGPGGFGPPGGQGDWAASVHDYNFKTNGITIQNTGHYFGLHLSPETAKALIQSNSQLMRNAGGVQGGKMDCSSEPSTRSSRMRAVGSRSMHHEMLV